MSTPKSALETQEIFKIIEILINDVINGDCRYDFLPPMMLEDVAKLKVNLHKIIVKMDKVVENERKKGHRGAV